MYRVDVFHFETEYKMIYTLFIIIYIKIKLIYFKLITSNTQ